MECRPSAFAEAPADRRSLGGGCSGLPDGANLRGNLKVRTAFCNALLDRLLLDLGERLGCAWRAITIEGRVAERQLRNLALRIARVRPMLGNPLVADLPELVRAGLPLPADEEEREKEEDCSPANDE
jgi:hypothetical protein